MKTIYKISLALLTTTMMMVGASKTHAQLALDLAGPGNFSSTNYLLDTSGFTIEYDMYIHNHQNYNAGVTFTTGNNPGPIDYYVNSGGAPNSTAGNGGAYSSIAFPVISSGVWHNVAYVYPGSAQSIKIYIDGVWVGQHWPFSVQSGPPFCASGFLIGDRGDFATNADAKYDNVKIWSSPRTAAQVVSDMNTCFSGTEPNLDILYTMEEGSGATIHDLALGNGAQNGSITGTVTWTSGIDHTTYGYVSVNACSNYTWAQNGTTYFNTGNYFDTIPNSRGCDSIITLHLVLNPQASEPSISASTNLICNSGAVDINVDSGETGFIYTLRDNATNTLVDGPVNGNGGPITFNTGTISTTTTYNILSQPFPNKSMGFDGIDDRIIAGTSGSVINNYTVEAWVNPGTTTGYMTIMGSRAPFDNTFDLQLGNGILVHGDIGDGIGWQTNNADAAFNYSVSQWYHLAYVATPSNYFIYANGNLVGSGSLISGPVLFDGNHVLTIGDGSSTGGSPFNGLIDEVRVWNIARTQSQIMADMHIQLSGTEPGLVMYYNFNELAGTTSANDATTNNFDGVLTNMNASTARQSNTPLTISSCDYQFSTTPTITVTTVNTSVISNSPTLTSSASGATYQWIDCNNANATIAGATNQNFTATNNGSYAVIVTENGCTDTSACVTVANVSLENFGFDNNLKIYPNPTDGNFTIELGKIYQDLTMSIKNELGQVISSEFIGTTNQISHKMEAPKGIYFVEIKSSTGEQKTVKIIKR